MPLISEFSLENLPLTVVYDYAVFPSGAVFLGIMHISLTNTNHEITRIIRQSFIEKIIQEILDNLAENPIPDNRLEKLSIENAAARAKDPVWQKLLFQETQADTHSLLNKAKAH